MRLVSTRVLPDPAPATMSSGPPSCRTASRCCGLSPSSRVSGSVCRRARLIGAAPLGGRLGPRRDASVVDRRRAGSRSRRAGAGRGRIGRETGRRRACSCWVPAYVPRATDLPSRGRSWAYRVARAGRSGLRSSRDPPRHPARPLPGLLPGRDRRVRGLRGAARRRRGPGQPAEPGYAGYEFTRAGLQDPAEFARFVAQRVRAATRTRRGGPAGPPATSAGSSTTPTSTSARWPCATS